MLETLAVVRESFAKDITEEVVDFSEESVYKGLRQFRELNTIRWIAQRALEGSTLDILIA